MKQFVSLVGLLFSVSIYAQEPTSEPTNNALAKQPPPEEAPPAPEEEGGVSYGAEADVNAIYGWRGVVSSSGLVAQPSAWVSAKGATLTTWASFFANGEDGIGTFQEIDFLAEYELEAPAGFTVIPRVNAYLFVGAPLVEAEVEIDHDIAGPVSAFLTNAVGIGFVPGSYFGQVGLAFEQDFDFGLTLEGSAGFGVSNAKFNDYNIAVNKASAGLLLAGVAGTYSFLDDLMYVRLHTEAQMNFDDEIADAQDQALIINGGLAIGFEM